MSSAQPDNLMVRQGEAFHSLVTAIERALLSESGSILERSKRLRDSDTGRLREHDIVITWHQGHHKILTAIECRDTGRPVGVPAIEAFSKKCEKTAIHHAVMVSSSGFTETARTKAAALNIACMELREAQEFPWMAMTFFIEETKKFGHMNIMVLCNDKIPEGEFQIFDVNGVLVTNEMLMATIRNAVELPENLERYIGNRVPLAIHVNAPGWRVVDAAGIECALSHFEVSTDVSITRTFKPVTLHTYSGPLGPIEVASTDVEVGEFKGKLMIVHKNEGGRVILVSDAATAEN